MQIAIKIFLNLQRYWKCLLHIEIFTEQLTRPFEVLVSALIPWALNAGTVLTLKKGIIFYEISLHSCLCRILMLDKNKDGTQFLK